MSEEEGVAPGRINSVVSPLKVKGGSKDFHFLLKDAVTAGIRQYVQGNSPPYFILFYFLSNRYFFLLYEADYLRNVIRVSLSFLY